MTLPETILVASDDEPLRREAVHALRELTSAVVGLDTSRVASWLEKETPALVVVDAHARTSRSLPLAILAQHPRLLECPILALIDDGRDSALNAMSQGATDCITLPLSAARLVFRAQQQLAHAKRLFEVHRREHTLQTAVELIEQIAAASDVRGALDEWVRQIALMFGADRVSIVLVREGSDSAFVVTSNDDPSLRDHPLHVPDYPELEACAEGRSARIIDDVLADERFTEIVRRHTLQFRSQCVAPLRDERQTLGYLFLRSRRPGHFERSHISLLNTLGHAAGLAIRNAQLLQSLRAETQQSAEARLQAERRVRFFQPYAEFFKNSADGMVVMEPSGRLLFANPLARGMAGVNARLEGANVLDFLQPDEQARGRLLAKRFRDNEYPKGVDFRVVTEGDERILNVNFSATLRNEGAVLLTFRDVTRERATEQELLQTKGFLERVIESSVDAIVSADVEGKVLLFNHAASRIFGYAPTDVVGMMNVERLYPPGGARTVMRAIRGTDHGGAGRLVGHQVNMQDSAGRLVPVKISAALIHEKGRLVGSVGIFTDIRDQLRMQESLRQAQDQIREREKDMAVAQLAGATAHELNQPLTSVIAYSELLLRRVQNDESLAEPARVIIDQAERMANIVRHVGQLTRYETKTYVGSSQIIDLEKSSATKPEQD